MPRRPTLYLAPAAAGKTAYVLHGHARLLLSGASITIQRRRVRGRKGSSQPGTWLYFYSGATPT